MVKTQLKKTYDDIRFFPDLTDSRLNSINTMLEIMERIDRLTGGKCPKVVAKQTEL